jgi:DNA transformation protein and related proteins
MPIAQTATPARMPDIVAHCSELLAPLGSVRVGRMFGGWGFYVDGLFIALIAYERLYLKGDADSQPLFAAAGCEPFCFSSKGREMVTSYWSAPAEAMDAPALMEPWGRLAIQAALKARAAKTPRKPAVKKPATATRTAAPKVAVPRRGRA